MGMKHTPGPWEYESGGYDTHGLYGGDGVDGGFSIWMETTDPANVPGALIEIAQHVGFEPDAQLIAAAPERLDALKAMHEAVYLDNGPGKQSAAWAALFAAIERAEGEL